MELCASSIREWPERKDTYSVDVTAEVSTGVTSGGDAE